MMATDLENITQILESSDSSKNERAEAYKQINTLLKEEKKESLLDPFVSRLHSVLMKDSLEAEWALSAFKVLGYITHRSTAFSENQMREVINMISTTILNSKDKSICNVAVWCVSVQCFPRSAFIINPSTSPAKQQHPILKLVSALKHALDNPFKSGTIEFEAIISLGKLAVIAGDYLTSNDIITQWMPSIYKRIFNKNEKIREKSKLVLSSAIQHMKVPPESISQCLFEDLKNGLLSSFTDLMEETGKEEMVLIVWGYVVFLLGGFLVKGDLINALLKIPERAFVHPLNNVRVTTYQSWRYLIDNFAQTTNGLSQLKRIKLLMAPFANCISTETEALAKKECVVTWAHLLSQSNSQKVTDKIFDKVGIVFLDAVIKGTDTEFLGITCQSLASLIFSEKAPETTFPNEIIFNHFSYFLSLLEAVISKTEIEQSISTIENFWKSLVMRVSLIAKETGDSKPQPEIISLLHKLLFVLKDIVISKRVTSNDHLTAMFQAVLDNLVTPLSSSFYYLAIDEKLEQNESEKNIYPPIVYVIYLWMNVPCTSEFTVKYVNFLSSMMNIIYKATNVVSFLHIIVLLIMQIKNHKIILKLMESLSPTSALHILVWNNFAQGLSKFMESTQQITDGALPFFDNDYTLIYNCLLLPIRTFVNGAPANIDPQLTTDIWGQLFSTFYRICILKTPEPNSVIEALFSRVGVLVSGMEESALNSSIISFLVNHVSSVVSVIDLSNSLSSRKRRKDGSGTYLSLISLISKLLSAAYNSLAQNVKSSQKLLTSVSLIFKHAQTSEDLTGVVQEISSVLALWLQTLTPQGEEKGDMDISNYESLNKSVISLWDDIISSLSRCYKGPFDSELLRQLSPLLNAGLSNKYRNVKNSSLQFWNSSFGQSSSLKYPDLLIPALKKLKEKNAQINLPSWETKIEFNDIPSGDPSLEVDQENPPPTFPIPSGHMRSKLTQKIKVETKSPSKVLKTKANSNVHDKDYVEVASSNAPHSAVLTDHQLEVLQEQKKERAALMAYSGLDLSQDPNEFRNPFDLSLLRRTPDVKTTPTPTPSRATTPPVLLPERTYGKTEVISQLDVFEHLNAIENSISNLTQQQLFETQKKLLRLIERSIELSRT